LSYEEIADRPDVKRIARIVKNFRLPRSAGPERSGIPKEPLPARQMWSARP
jgi:hypothetical protein